MVPISGYMTWAGGRHLRITVLPSCRYAWISLKKSRCVTGLKRCMRRSFPILRNSPQPTGVYREALISPQGAWNPTCQPRIHPLQRWVMPTRIPSRTWQPLPWTRSMGMESATALTGSGCWLITRLARWITVLSSCAETTAA